MTGWKTIGGLGPRKLGREMREMFLVKAVLKERRGRQWREERMETFRHQPGFHYKSHGTLRRLTSDKK